MSESQIFANVLKLATPAERAAYLDEACAGNPPLRAGVEALLQAHANDPGFLEQPVGPIERTVDEPPAPAVPDAPPAEPGDKERPGMVLAGRYKLLEPIGEGGMGTVWMAQQTEPVKRVVAVKLIKAGMDSKQVLARFEAERQALALMDHPNIAKVFDAGTTAGEPGRVSPGSTPGANATGLARPFFVMELVKGVPITKYCDEHRLTPRQRLELFVPVCQAIQHAHTKGIIHRDLKPSNVLVARYDDRPVPKVIDFGVAKATGQQLTERTLHTGFGAIVGTVEYMSPEQASFNQLDVDTRSDVYSLGVLLYELLAGSPPFSAKESEKAGLLEIMRLIREQEPPRPSIRLSTADGLPTLAANRGTEPKRLTALVRGELDWIVMKALEKDRSRRYETANGFALDLQRYLADETVQACPPSALYKIRKFARRHKGPVLAASAVLLALLVGVGLATWQAVRATRAEALADAQRQDALDAGQQAIDERNRANAAADEARANAAATRRALDRMMVAEGLRLAEQGQLFAALPWLLRPLERGGLTPEEEKVHRTRLACYLRHTPGRPTLRHMLFHDGPVSHAAWSADATRLLTVSEKAVHVWDVRSGEPIVTLRHQESVTTAQFTLDGARVRTATEGAPLVWTWDVASGRLMGQPFVVWEMMPRLDWLTLPHSPWDVVGRMAVEKSNADNSDSATFHDRYRAAFHPDGTRVLMANRSLRMYDLEKRQPVSDLMHLKPGDCVSAMSFSYDGTHFLTEGRKNQLWNVSTAEILSKQIGDENTPRSISARAISPDNRHICLGASWSLDLPHFRLWDVHGGRWVDTKVKLPGNFAAACFRPDGRQIVTSCIDGTVAIWDRTASRLMAPWLKHQSGVNVASMSPNGRFLITGDEDGIARVWDLAGDHDRYFALPSLAERDLPPAFGNVIFFGAKGEGWAAPHRPEVSSGSRGASRLAKLGFKDADLPLNCALSPDKHRLVTEFRQPNVLQFWDAATSVPIGQPHRYDSGNYWVAFSPDNRLVVTTGDAVHLYDAAAGSLAFPPLRHGDSVYHAQFSADSKLLVTASADGTARLWSTTTGQPVGRPLHHADEVNLACFNPNGQQVATACADRTVQLWDVATGERHGPPLSQGDAIGDVLFSPDGLLLLVRLDPRR